MKKEKLFLALLTAAMTTPATLSVTNSIIPVLAESNGEKINLATLGSTDIFSIPADTAYTGNPIETLPAISVDPSKTNGNELNSSDYTASWITTSPINVGTYGIKVTANTNSTHFEGENTRPTFSITKRNLKTVDIELTGISSFDSKNPAKAPTISKITDKTSKETLNLVKDTDYTVTYTLILDNGDEKAPDALDGAIPKKGKITITAKGENCLPTSTASKEFTFTNANDNSSVSSSTSNSSTSSSNSSSSSSSSSNSSSNTIGSSTTTGSTNSKPTLTLPTNVIAVESNGPLKSAEVTKLENYIKSNHNKYGYDLKVNSASVAIENGQSTFTMSITAQLENDSKIDITLSNLKKRRSEDAMIEENEFVEFIDLEEEMEDASLDYVTVDDPGKDGKKVTIKGIKASDAFRVNNYLNGTKIRNILTDAGYKVSDLNFSSAAKMNHEFSITDLSKPISIVASATPQSSSTTTTPSKPVGGNGIIQLPSSPAKPTTPTVVKKPTYRFFNTLTGEHFYTTSEAERDELMKDSRWNNEGQGWISPETSRIVVYRLCNPNTGEHHYTTDKNEYDTLPAYGWRQEGIGFYSADPQLSDIAVVYRLFNPKANNAGSHHYTLSEQERNNLVNNGWRDEGIAWYGIREDLPTNSDIPSQPDTTPNTPTSENIDLKGYYVHSSGVGAWGTELTIDDNNHFIGKYEDSNIKEVFFCQYSGDIIDIQKVGDKKYIGRIANLQRELPSQAWLASFPSDVKVEEVDNPSFKNGDQVMIYLAGYPVNQVSEAEYSWMGIWGSLLTDKTPGIFITNLDNEWSGFCGYDLPSND